MSYKAATLSFDNDFDLLHMCSLWIVENVLDFDQLAIENSKVCT